VSLKNWRVTRDRGATMSGFTFNSFGFQGPRARRRRDLVAALARARTLSEKATSLYLCNVSIL
jgi:hypothetical protein